MARPAIRQLVENRKGIVAPFFAQDNEVFHKRFFPPVAVYLKRVFNSCSPVP